MTNQGIMHAEVFRKTAFTFIELLVVVAISSMLAAPLLVSLEQVKKKARLVQCIINQRQIALAWTTYSSDHEDQLVANGDLYSGTFPPPARLEKTWIEGQLRYGHNNTNELYLTDPQYALLGSYIKTAKTYFCPSDRANLNYGGEVLKRVRSYCLNYYLNTITWESRVSPGYRMFRRSSQLSSVRPSEIFTVLDVNPDSICFPYFGMIMDRDYFFNYPGTAHENGGVISFADGHVIPHRWTDPRTISPNLPYYHNHYDVSPRNPDLQWLRERTTVKE